MNTTRPPTADMTSVMRAFAVCCDAEKSAQLARLLSEQYDDKAALASALLLGAREMRNQDTLAQVTEMGEALRRFIKAEDDWALAIQATSPSRSRHPLLRAKTERDDAGRGPEDIDDGSPRTPPRGLRPLRMLSTPQTSPSRESVYSRKDDTAALRTQLASALAQVATLSALQESGARALEALQETIDERELQIERAGLREQETFDAHEALKVKAVQMYREVVQLREQTAQQQREAEHLRRQLAQQERNADTLEYWLRDVQTVDAERIYALKCQLERSEHEMRVQRETIRSLETRAQPPQLPATPPATPPTRSAPFPGSRSRQPTARWCGPHDPRITAALAKIERDEAEREEAAAAAASTDNAREVIEQLEDTLRAERRRMNAKLAARDAQLASALRELDTARERIDFIETCNEARVTESSVVRDSADLSIREPEAENTLRAPRTVAFGLSANPAPGHILEGENMALRVAFRLAVVGAAGSFLVDVVSLFW